MPQESGPRKKLTRSQKGGRPRAKDAVLPFKEVTDRFFRAIREGCPEVLRQLRDNCLPPFSRLANPKSGHFSLGHFSWSSYQEIKASDEATFAFKSAIEQWAIKSQLIQCEWCLDKALHVLHRWVGDPVGAEHLILPDELHADDYVAEVLALAPYTEIKLFCDLPDPVTDRTFKRYRGRAIADMEKRIDIALCGLWQEALQKYRQRRLAMKTEERGALRVGWFCRIPEKEELVWRALACNVCLREPFDSLGNRLNLTESVLRKAVRPLAEALGLETTLRPKRSGK